MKLKQIELQGFKSFQSKSVFKIDSNLIGIVGPNGSGKSNIIDAIRWVLGEQSAKNLRGSSMKDVIFSGTADKKGKNFAEVSLTFTTEENENKTITRRVYKNGDSEYLLDGKKSKLKDITDVYFDLGINKESYSIITQGKVESILASKPQDRRIIIEEAAGVLKYKNKKKETNFKLEKTSENINRLNDIFLEIENRYEILSSQKERTEKYLQYNDELLAKDITLKVYDIKHISALIEDANDNKKLYIKNKSVLENESSNIDNELRTIKENVYKLDTIYNTKKEEELKLATEQEKLRSLIALSTERTDNKKIAFKKLLADKEQFVTRKENLNRRLFETREELSNIKAELAINAKKTKVLNLEDKNKLVFLEEEIEKLKDEYFSLISEESKLENNLTLLAKIKENNSQNIGNINIEINNINKNLVENVEQHSFLESELKTAELHKLECTDNIQNIEQEKLILTNKQDKILEQLSKGKELLTNFKNKKEFLESQSSSNNHYNVGVKEILAVKDKISGIHATVGEILTFDKNYMTALDIALSTAQQNIIVADDNVARLCVEHLKKVNKGRATFLPLSNINARTIDSNVLKNLEKVEGFINIAAKLVDFDKKYNNIVAHLLGLVIVVDNLQNGNKIAKLINFKYRIVTLDGQVINSGGSITGGAIYKNSTSVIKIKAEIDELLSNISQVSKKIEELNDELLTIDKQLIANKENLSKEQEKLQMSVITIKELTVKLELLTDSIEKLKLSLDTEQFKLKDYNSELQVLDNEDDIKARIKDIKNNVARINSSIEQLSLEKNTAKESSEKLQQLINNINIEESKLLESSKNKEEQLKQLTEDLQYINKQIEKADLELSTLESNNISEVNVEDYKISLENYNDSLLKLRDNLEAILTEKEGLYKEELELNNVKKDKSLELQNIISKIEEINLQTAKQEVKIDDALNYLITTYNTTYEREEERFNDISIAEISSYKTIVADLKNKIAALGNVNLNAIEEYNEVAERYNFYKTEIEDLVSSKEKLQATIKEIDKEVEERFLTTFEKIAQNFDRIYKALFNGGHAKITLENAQDILNTGINIEVSPPGKKLQKLSLLSGGEKALTAISLLFSILEITNSPFVILDEVEAALDEVNVQRFAKFLKHYSKENQFLVITHRRGTMEEMDKLYGVTMKEQGISYILPLELKNILEEDYN